MKNPGLWLRLVAEQQVEFEFHDAGGPVADDQHLLVRALPRAVDVAGVLAGTGRADQALLAGEVVEVERVVRVAEVDPAIAEALRGKAVDGAPEVDLAEPAEIAVARIDLVVWPRVFGFVGRPAGILGTVVGRRVAARHIGTGFDEELERIGRGHRRSGLVGRRGTRTVLRQDGRRECKQAERQKRKSRHLSLLSGGISACPWWRRRSSVPRRRDRRPGSR